MIESIFKNVLIMSLVGSLLASLIMIAKPLTQKMFGFKWQYYIWYIVLTVMILPLSVTIVTDKNSMLQDTPVHFDVSDYEHSSAISQNVGVGENQSEQRKVNANRSSAFKSVAYIWFLYGSVTFLFKIVWYILYLHIVRKKSIKFQRRGNVQIWYTSLVSAPLTLGLFRKKILVPQCVEDEKTLELILLHEKTHIKHGDIFFKWLCMLVKCVHWFNPIVYIFSKETEQLCEIVCDIEVTKNMDIAQQKLYMNTILSMVTSALRNTSELTTHMANSKSCITERFAAIVSSKSRKSDFRKVSLSLAVAMTFVSFGISSIACGRLCDESPFCITLDLTKDIVNDSDDSKVVINSGSLLGKELESALSATENSDESNDFISDTTKNKDKKIFTNKLYDEAYYGNSSIITSDNINPGESVKSSSEILVKSDNQSISNFTLVSPVNTESNNAVVPEELIVVEDENNIFEETVDEPVYDKYPYSGQVKFDGLTFEKITSEIDGNGGSQLYADNSAVADGYIAGKLTYKNDGVANHKKIKCDDQGQIMFYMDSEYDQHVSIVFNQNGKQIAGYGIIPDNETAYVFGGFDPGEEYEIEISTSTGSTWMIESDYLLY